MEIKFIKAEVLNGLSLIQGIVERKTTMPILANVLLDASEKRLSITATDLEVGMNIIHPVEVLTKGKVTVHARTIYDMIRGLPDEMVTLKVNDGNWIEISCGKSRYKFMGLSPDEFPVLPARGQSEIWNMDAKILEGMIEKASFAMSTDENRFNLNGVYIDPIKKEGSVLLRMVATDGHRLSIVERDVGVKCGIHKGVIIPRKGIVELKKLAEGADSTLELWFDPKYLIAYRDNITLVVRLIEGQFPPYEQVVPKQSKRIVSVDKSLLMMSLKRVSVISTDLTMGVKFSITSNNMDIFASNPDLGEAREELDVAYKGERFEVGFNSKYFLEALASIDDEKAVLQLGNDDTAPCVLRSEVDRGFTHVIMPMRL